MEKIKFKNYEEPALDADTLNELQDNIEKAIEEAIEEAKSTNIEDLMLEADKRRHPVRRLRV